RGGRDGAGGGCTRGFASGRMRWWKTSSKTRADVNAGTLCGSRFVTSPARTRMRVPPFFGWLPLVGDGPADVVGAHAAMTVARITIAADSARFIRGPSPR